MISLDADQRHADVDSYVFAWHERPDGSTATMMGQYRDRVVRVGEMWRIAQRRQELMGNDAGFDVRINPFVRIEPPESG
jgi:hypothetical protein